MRKRAFIKFGYLIAKLYALASVIFFTLLIMSVAIPGVGVITITIAYSILDGIEKAEDICVRRAEK